MNNIIKSQWLLCKKRILLIVLFIVFVMLSEFFVFSTTEKTSEALPMVALIAVIIFTAIPTVHLMYSYAERIQMYEIMAGFTPHQIILGKTIVCLPITMICLGCFSIMCLCFDSSADMVRRLLLFWVIGIRSVLCIVFFSPFTKKGVLAPLSSIMLLLVFGQSDLYAVAHSPLALLCCGQCVSLGTEITNAFITKVIVSAVVSCVIYYLIGYLTLKKKIALELHQLT